MISNQEFLNLSGCYTEDTKSKSYPLTIKSTEHKDQEAFQNSEESQTNYNLNEGINMKKYKVKARFRSELNEISPFFPSHLRMDFLTRVFQLPHYYPNIFYASVNLYCCLSYICAGYTFRICPYV
jgi:hypothetical protein